MSVDHKKNNNSQQLIVEEMHSECLDITERITGKMKVVINKETSMNAQGQVKVSLLSAGLIAVKTWICLPRSHHGTSFTQTNVKTASENILMAHACRAHTGQIDGRLRL